MAPEGSSHVPAVPDLEIVSAVFFGINTLDLLISLLQVHAVATLLIGVVIWLVGLGAIVLMYGRESGLFYKRQPT